MQAAPVNLSRDATHDTHSIQARFNSHHYNATQQKGDLLQTQSACRIPSEPRPRIVEDLRKAPFEGSRNIVCVGEANIGVKRTKEIGRAILGLWEWLEGGGAGGGGEERISCVFDEII